MPFSVIKEKIIIDYFPSSGIKLANAIFPYRLINAH
jgi:hypothetical protein